MGNFDIFLETVEVVIIDNFTNCLVVIMNNLDTRENISNAFSVSANHQHIIVNVNNVPISMIVDSGASCNIINSDIARKLVNNGAKSVQKKT